MSARIICLLIGYAFGLVQTGYLYGRANGIDIRDTGSGNAGTTNALRTLGLKAGLITLAGDLGKCIVAVLVTWLIFRNRQPELIPLLKIYTSAGVILGHDFPFYLNFRGGKGIAATGGMIIAFGDIRLILVGLITFVALFVLTHYVSLASICLSLSFLIGIAVVSKGYGMPVRETRELLILVAVLTVIAVAAHRGNIVRLVHGNERKTYLTKKNKTN